MIKINKISDIRSSDIELYSVLTENWFPFIFNFKKLDGYGCGYRYGYGGHAYGYGDGDGDGCGFVYGGFGFGDGYGHGYAYGGCGYRKGGEYEDGDGNGWEGWLEMEHTTS